VRSAVIWWEFEARAQNEKFYKRRTLCEQNFCVLLIGKKYNKSNFIVHYR